MKTITFLIIPFIVSLSCGQSENPVSETLINSEINEKEKADSVEKVENPFDDSLKIYFESPLDFYALKKKTQHMLDGGKRDMPESYFHPSDNPDAIFYTYMCLERVYTKEFTDDDLQFATWKPWKTAQQKYYETDNEILLGIRCKINWDVLGNSNFVGMHIDSVKAKFGKPHAVDNT